MGDSEKALEIQTCGEYWGLLRSGLHKRVQREKGMGLTKGGGIFLDKKVGWSWEMRGTPAP